MGSRACYSFRRVVHYSGMLILFLVMGCATELVPGTNRPTDAHENYLASLEKAGLGSSAVVKKWRDISRDVIDHPLTVTAPYREEGFFDPIEPEAVGYRFFIVRGRRVSIEFETQDPAGTLIYADLFRMEQGKNGEPEVPAQVASRGSSSNRIDFEPRKDGWYVFRLQPELLKGGRFSVFINSDASLNFPVTGGSMKNAISAFGDPRDGGSRKHEGIDIAALKGTPVTAPVRAFVSRVGRSVRGGNVVWLWDQERSLRLYFAHLDTQAVITGTWVNPGEVIGTVGNTGNAVNTPPHLHFGVYIGASGAVDPHAFIQPAEIPSVLSPAIPLLGLWARVRPNGIHLSESLSPGSQPVARLASGTPVRVQGDTGEYVRVALPDGRSGYIRAVQLESADSPVGRRVLSRQTVLYVSPESGAEGKGSLPEGEELTVIGTYGGYLFVRTEGGETAWIDPKAS